MGRVGVAFRAFFAALSSSDQAQRLAAALEGGMLPKIDDQSAKAAQTQPAAIVRAEPEKPARSEAVTLLAALQREARLVDLVQQPLAQFSDEQIGGAARNVLADCQAVLNRFFELRPVADAAEGESVNVPSSYDPSRFKLAGSASGSGPFRGQLVHHGWQATAVKLPAWTGSKEASLIIAPAEVEV